MVPSGEACLFGCINWSVSQAEQDSSMGLSWSFPSKIGGKTRSQTQFHFSVQKRPVPESSGASLAKRLQVQSRLRLTQVAGSMLVVMSLPCLLMLGRREAMGVSTCHVS